MGLPHELLEPVELCRVHLFRELPPEAQRRSFIDEGAERIRRALVKYSPDGIDLLTARERSSGELEPEEIEQMKERVAGPRSELEGVARANLELFARRREAAERGDGLLADRLFREAVLALWRADRHVEAVEYAFLRPSGALLSELQLPGGQSLRLIAQTGHRRAIRALAFAPGGKRLVSASDDGRAISWDAATGMELCTWWPEDADLRGEIVTVALSESGDELLAESARGDVVRWGPGGPSLEMDRIQTMMPDAPASLDLAALAASPPGVRAALERAAEVSREAVVAAAVSPSGALVAAGTASGALVAVDTATGEVAWRVPAMRLAITEVVWQTDGRLTTTAEDGARGDWDLTAGRLAAVRPAGAGDEATPGGDPLDVDSLAIEPMSPPGPYTAHVLRDRATGEIAGFADGRKCSALVQVSRGRRRDRALALHADGSAGLGEIPGKAGWLAELRFSWVARLRHAGAVALSPDGRFAAVGREDGVLQVWEPGAPGAKQRLCSALGFPDGRWAVSDDEGRFDASHGGAAAGLHWALDAEPILLEQLKERYYDPFLLAKKLGRHPEPPRRVDPFEPKLAPHVAIDLEDPGPGKYRIRIVITDRGAGIGPVSVAINGKEAFVCRIDGAAVVVEQRVPFEGWSSSGVEAGPDGALRMTCRFNLAGHPYRRSTAGISAPGGARGPGAESAPAPLGTGSTAAVSLQARDDVRVVALDAGRTVSSREVRRSLPEPPSRPSRAPHLWAIVAGVARYSGERLRLRYAAKDAEDFGAALSVAGAALFGADHVHVRILSTERAGPEEQPTRANIASAFASAREAAAGDVLVLYLAGHGVQHREGADDDFYFLTAEAVRGDLSDPAARAEEAISSEELTAWIHHVPALKQVMILDACHAGQLAADLVEARALPSSQVRALERMKDRTGLFVLAGAEAGAVSLEASRYAQGLLTHALLFGMRGPALREGDLVDVQRLAAFAIEEVPRLAEGEGGVQRPVLAAPLAGSTFDIGLVGAEARARIPLSEPVPALRRADFQDRSAMEDVIGLGDALDAALAERCADVRAAPFVLVSGRTFPGALRLLGSYSMKEDRVTVTVRLVSGEGRLIDDRRFKGTRAALEALARRIAGAVVDVFRPSSGGPVPAATGGRGASGQP